MFIDESDHPELLRSTVNGKPGFRLQPNGEDDGAIFFESERALVAWTERVMRLMQSCELAQPYEEWLEMNQ